MGKTLRGLKVVIENGTGQNKTVINTLRWTFHELATKYGDPKIRQAFSRAKGITSEALMSPFGCTYYYANSAERDKAFELLMECIPVALVGKIKFSKWRRKVSQEMFKSKVYTLKVNNAA